MRSVRMWDESGLPKRHQIRKPEEVYRHNQWYSAYRRAMKAVGEGGIVALLGNRGTGKTQIATECARAMCRDCRTCRYVSGIEIGLLVRASYREGGPTESAAINALVQPHLLMIDELQERPDTEFERRLLVHVIDRRYGAMLPTILIANSDIKELVSIIGASIADRMRESGGVIDCNWPSFRGT